MNSSQDVIVQEILLEKNQTTVFSFQYFAYFFVFLFLFAVFSMRKKKMSKTKVMLIGERNSGKTQLFITLNKGKQLKTSPSIHNNKCKSFQIAGKKYEMIDFIGDNISKEELLQTIDEAHCVIHVLDGTDQKLLSDGAMLIYKVLVSKIYQKNPCNYIILLNKSDVTGYMGKEKAMKRIQDEIQHIKRARINEGEENQNEEDYIKLSKGKFKLPFSIIEGNASNLKNLEMTLENL